MEDLRFKLNFSEDGASKLSHTLTISLKDYMGDFVDDTLVKYVIVLLRNGRSKGEVKQDLDVFLGDNSDAFVNWLWDHLASSLDQYVQPVVPSINEAEKSIPDLVEHNGDTESQPQVSDSEKVKSVLSRNRHNRDWKGLMSDESHPPLRSSVNDDTQKKEKMHKKVVHTRRSASPEHPVNKKRSRADERTVSKKEVSQTTIAASRRLLQFAVRDAVATTRPSHPVSEPGRKRLRSVVSTATGNSREEVRSQKAHPVARESNSAITAIRAAAEAAEDVKRAKYGNVFDRLSYGVDDGSELVSAFGKPAVEVMEYQDYDDIHGNSRDTYVRTREHTGTRYVNSSLVDSNTGLASDFASDNDGYDNVSGQRVMDISETGTSRGKKADESLMAQYSVAQNTDAISHRTRKKKGQEPLISDGSNKHKIVNISVNVNTWKPSHYQPASHVIETGSQKLHAENDTGPANPVVRLMRDTSVTVLGNGKPAALSQKEVQKTASAPGSNPSDSPPEDADSRTIFVNNVHFAATKDTVSRHFSKFGEVLKVMILTDAATSHPKGSAYVEFMQKEAAENALSFDGTSFMSRIIKVVKKSSAQQEASPMMNWPRSTRGSSFTVTRYAQAPFPSVFPGAYRGWPAMKPAGMRSMQWKRGEGVSPVSGNITTTKINTPSAGRGLTYVRPVSKTDGNAAGA